MLYVGQQFFKRVLLHQQVGFLVVADPVHLPHPVAIVRLILQVELDQPVGDRPLGRENIVPEIIELREQEIGVRFHRHVYCSSFVRPVDVAFRALEQAQKPVQYPECRLFVADLLSPSPGPIFLVSHPSYHIRIVDQTPLFGEQHHLGLHYLLSLCPCTRVTVKLHGHFHQGETIKRVIQRVGRLDGSATFPDLRGDRVHDRLKHRCKIVVSLEVPYTKEGRIHVDAFLFVIPNDQRDGRGGEIGFINKQAIVHHFRVPRGRRFPRPLFHEPIIRRIPFIRLSHSSGRPPHHRISLCSPPHAIHSFASGPPSFRALSPWDSSFGSLTTRTPSLRTSFGSSLARDPFSLPSFGPSLTCGSFSLPAFGPSFSGEPLLSPLFRPCTARNDRPFHGTLRQRFQVIYRGHFQPKMAKISLLPVRILAAVGSPRSRVPICFRREQHVILILETVLFIYLEHAARVFFL